MTKEWADWYNSFNSAKGLTYIENYKAIEEWKVGKRDKPLPPIEISIDPINLCQLKCQHCNYGKYLKSDKINRLDDEHYLSLIRFFADWKVKGLCHGGGGCPTLHTKLWDALLLSKSLGLENSTATNGINFNDETIDIAVRTCRWIGVSVDSATEETYGIGRKANYFNKVIENIKKLTKRAKELNTNCDVSFKFLVFNYNQHEIYDACKLAKEIGVRDIHIRPADFRHQGISDETIKNPYDIELILKQFEECQKLNSKDFRVFTVIHKFNEDFTPLRTFSQCYASSLCLQVNPSGSCYLCPDTRELEFYKLGEHYPDPKNILNFWGSKKHYDLVFNSGCSNCKSRCTFNHYNIQCERLAINKDDPMCLSFV